MLRPHPLAPELPLLSRSLTGRREADDGLFSHSWSRTGKSLLFEWMLVRAGQSWSVLLMLYGRVFASPSARQRLICS